MSNYYDLFPSTEKESLFSYVKQGEQKFYLLQAPATYKDTKALAIKVDAFFKGEKQKTSNFLLRVLEVPFVNGKPALENATPTCLMTNAFVTSKIKKTFVENEFEERKNLLPEGDRVYLFKLEKIAKNTEVTFSGKPIPLNGYEYPEFVDFDQLEEEYYAWVTNSKKDTTVVTQEDVPF